MIFSTTPEEERSAPVLLEKIRSSIEVKEFIYNDLKLHLTVTIGAAYHRSEQTIDNWVNLADTRLYYGKQTGKNRVISADAF